MSGVDLTVVLERARIAVAVTEMCGLPGHDDAVLVAVAEAAVLVERQVREQIAAEIEAMDSPPAVNAALVSRLHAARIARGATS
jgi:hypothetical protein